MECLERPFWNSETAYTWESLLSLKIDRPDEEIRRKVLANWDRVAKPLNGMGRFEDLTAQIGAVLRTEKIDIAKKAVIIMCADNGIVAEGVSQSGQEVTLAVVKNMTNKQSSVGRMAETVRADTIPVDIGINCQEKIPGVLDKKIRCGTRNFNKEPAMTREETLKAIFTGIELVFDCKEKGYGILATGEMGIGNTTTSSAVAAALLGCDAEEVTGRGAGLSDEGLICKLRVIAEALTRYHLRDKEEGGKIETQRRSERTAAQRGVGVEDARMRALHVLETVGGLDIAGLVGVCMGGALFRVPIVLDGVISMVAALLAERMLPGTRDYFIPSHKGKEPAAEKIAKELKLHPVIDGEMALGEGTGAVMMFALLDLALAVYQEGASFSDIRVEQYRRY